MTPPQRFALPPKGGDTSGPAKLVPRYLWMKAFRSGKVTLRSIF